MPVAFINLKKQYHAIKEEINSALSQTLENCNFIMGPNVSAFEQELARYLGTNHAIACASGSDALLLALMAAGVKEDDEVITTPFTFFATAGAIARLKARPVFAEIDGRTFNIDAEAIITAITPKTRAIIMVHLYGQPADMAPVIAEAKKHGIIIIEDCAQSIGARYENKYTAAIGDIGCLSFFPTKNLGCYGDGGAITTNKGEYAQKLKILRVHGAKPKYHHKFIGINSRLDEIQAAVLRVKLKYLDSWNERRRQIAAHYDELLKNVPEIHIPYRASYGGHIFHQYAILIKNRDEILKKLNEAQIAAGVYYPEPLHLQECFKYLNYKKGDFPVCESVCSKIMSLPIYAEMTDDDVSETASVLIKALKQ